MINLLPPSEKEKILEKRIKKTAVILWLLVLFFLICLVLILLFFKLYIQGQIQSQKVVLNSIKEEFEKSGSIDFQEKIDSVKLDMLNLNSFYETKIYLVDVLEKISKTIPENVYLKNISASSVVVNGEAFFKFDISGFSPSREVLFEFKENLEKEAGFQKTYFPPSNWIKSTDIDFYVSFVSK